MPRNSRLILAFILAAVFFAVSHLCSMRDSASAQQKPVGNAAKWEYKIIVYTAVYGLNNNVDAEKTAAANEKNLNTLAADGWDLDRDHAGYLILKRPKR